MGDFEKPTSTPTPATTGQDRQNMLKKLSDNIKQQRQNAQPLLERDEKIRTPFQQLEKAIAERLEEKR